VVVILKRRKRRKARDVYDLNRSVKKTEKGAGDEGQG
jgi:hypothetical protein